MKNMLFTEAEKENSVIIRNDNECAGCRNVFYQLGSYIFQAIKRNCTSIFFMKSLFRRVGDNHYQSIVILRNNITCYNQ